MRPHTALWLLVLALLAAAALRLPALAGSPPGAHFDEAANGVLAAEIAFDGDRPVFIPSYTGKETLYFYLAALVTRGIGRGLFALRLTSALLGLLTVAATYRVGRALRLRREPAVLAAALLAVTFAHVLLSRLGFRAIAQPLLQALSVAFLWEGLHRNSRARLLAGGVALGLTAYTYLAARIFPLPLALGLLPLLLHPDWRRRLAQLLTAGAAALLTSSPLLLYFIRNPERFWVRIDQVAPSAGSGIGASYLQSLAMFFLQGDPYVRFNLAGKPLFGWFWGGLLLAGWLALLLRAHRLPPLQRAGAVFLLLVPWLMLLPTALAVGEIVPSNLRAIGVLPFICLLPALGAELLLRSAGGSLAPTRQPQLAIALVGGTLLLGGYFTATSYYVDWSQRSDLFYENDGDLAAAADYIDALPDSDERIYVGARHYQHPTLALLSERYDALYWLPESAALVVPHSAPARYIYPRSSPAPAWLTTIFSPTTTTAGPLGPDGAHVFVAYTLANPESALIPAGQGSNLGGFVTVRAVDAGSGTSGGLLPVTLVWQVNQLTTEPLLPFVHLEDAWGQRWSQLEPFVHPTDQWAVGDTVYQKLLLPVPAGAPPGFYRLRVGFFNPETGQALGLLDTDGRYAGTALTVEDVAVLGGTLPETPPRPPIPLDGAVAPGLRLTGYAPPAPTVGTGETLTVALYWLARTPQQDLKLRFELLRPDNTGRVLLNTVPVHGTYPFDTWETPQAVVDWQQIPIPVDLDAGTYQLILRIVAPDGASLLSTRLGAIGVTATARLFNPPPVDLGLEATFSGEIRLRGYTLTPRPAGRTVDLQLVWEALQPPAGDYTVFVHLLAPDGVCCVWQADARPQQNSSATSRWLRGEFVVDDYVITIPADAPPGLYPLELGLYIPESGRRLQVTIAATGAAADALFLKPIRLSAP